MKNRRHRQNEDLRKLIRYCNIDKKELHIYRFLGAGNKYFWRIVVDSNPIKDIVDEEYFGALRKLARVL